MTPTFRPGRAAPGRGENAVRFYNHSRLDTTGFQGYIVFWKKPGAWLMKYNGVVARKLDLIGQHVSRLRGLVPLTRATLENDFFLRSGIERTLQVCIEAMIDVANRIICLENRPVSTDSFASLRQLQDLHVLADAERYRNMIKFRNLIVHRYEQIDTDILVMVVNQGLDDFDHFTHEVEQHERQG